MSEILRARDRLMSKSKGILEAEEEETREKKYPRKFTLSSLTQHFEKQTEHEVFSPLPKQITRNKTMRPEQVKDAFSDLRSNREGEKESRIYRRITAYNIQQNQKPYSPIRLHKKEADFEKQESCYVDSPVKKQDQRPLYSQKINLIMTVQPRRIDNSPMKPRECEREKAEEFIRKNISLKRCFVDEYFPPGLTIVFNRKVLYQEEGLKFERATKIFQQQIQLVRSYEPTLLTQGKFTNSYLYSALAILCEDPLRVLGLFGCQQPNEEGIYYVNLCKDGVWRYVFIDDFLPIKLTHRQPKLLFLHSRERDKLVQIWPALVEKAIAKIYGTYSDLSMCLGQGVTPLFRILTGLPVSEFYLHKDFRSYLIVIDAALKRKHIVVLEGISEQNEDVAVLKQLLPHHSYKLVDIRKNSIALRNMQEPQLITKLTFEEALIFTKLLVFRSESNYVYQTQKLRHTKKCYSVVELTVRTPTKGYWDVWENNPAYYKRHLGSSIQYVVSPYHLEIRQEQGEAILAESGKEVDLNLGTYMLLVHLCQQREQDFTLSFYGEKEITMKRVKNMNNWEEPCQCKLK